MPIRVYECDNCGHRFDELYFGKYPKRHKCEKCGHMARNIVGPVVYRLAFDYGGFDIGAGRSFYSQKERDEWLVKTNKRRIKD